VLIAGLPTGHKIGLGLVGLAFVLFALSSSFLLPRVRRDFPGKGGVGGFVAVSVLFFCGMIAAVWFFGQEPKEHEARAATPPTTTVASSTGASSTTTAQATTTASPTTTAAPATTQAAPAAPAGDPAAGKTLFASNGCGACHTFKPAGAAGNVGPDLDHVAADAQKANRGPLDKYVAESIKDPGAYVVPGFPNGVMPSFASLGDKQIADLVAFVTQKS
jgi:mono/diheme cytochrome c family protein